MDDDQFQGGLSGQGGNPVPANNSNTYDFTNGDPLANIDNPQAAAEADPADNIAVDPLANEPIMDLTNNVNIASSEVPAEPETAAPEAEPEGPISEMSRKMDLELGNAASDIQANVPAFEPTPAAEPEAPAAEPVAPAPAAESTVEATPQILAPEAEAAPEAAPAEGSAMAFETTEIPGQAPAPAANDDIPSLTGESRPSIATVNNDGKKPNKSLIIVLIAAIVLIGGTIAAMMIIPNLTKGSKKNNSSSQQSNSGNQEAEPKDPDDEEEEEVEKTQVVGRVERGYLTIPATWKQVTDASDATAVKYADDESGFVVFLNSGPITEVTAESYTNLQLGYSKEEAKNPDAVKAVEKTIGNYTMFEIKSFSTTTNKYSYKYIFESAKTGYTYFIWMECADEDSPYFTSIPKSFTTVKK